MHSGIISLHKATPSLSVSELDAAVERLSRALSPVAIYVFGSQAEEQPTRASDLDLLVVMRDDPPEAIELCRRGYDGLRGIDLPIELHIWGEATFERWAIVPASLPHVVKTRGRLLYAA